MANISKQRREELIRKINEIKNAIHLMCEDINKQTLVQYLSDLESEIKSKKYGLVYEEHKECIDEILENNTPVLIEDESLFIDNGGKMNFLIEGDNLASLILLKKTLRNMVDVIYIDPPYNTGNKDFVYNDDAVDKVDTFRHSKWLSFMQKRLQLSRTLLSEKGLIFVSIDDNEQAVLKTLCDSIFNEQNYITMFIRKTKSMTGDDGNGLNIQHEYLLVYAKDKSKATFIGEKKTFEGYSNPDNDPNGIWCSADPSAKSGGETTYFPIKNPYTGQVDYPPKGRYWAFSQETLKKYISSGRVKFKKEIKKGQRGFIFKRYAENMEVKTNPVDTLYFCDNAYMNSIATTETNNLIGAGKFSYPKPVEFIKHIIKYASNEKSLIIDFFAGSGTTGHAVMQLNKEDGGNRSFVLCTNNENNICRDVTYERIKRVIEKENYQASLKYMKVDFVPISEQFYYEYADQLLLHIRELVELENGINFKGNSEIAIILTDEELEEFINSNNDNCKTIYLGHDVLPTGEHLDVINARKIKINIIPDYYYGELGA